MTEPRGRQGPREIRDVYGHRYRVGTSDHELIGRSRAWVLVACWAVMLAVSGSQYGYGVIAPRLAQGRGWGLEWVFWGFALWVACQAAAVGALARLRTRGRRPAPGPTVMLGAVGCAVGLGLLAQLGDAAAALVGYAVAGGVGAGLVYGTCLVTVSGWYPDKPVRVGVASGAFAYGAVPLVLVLATVPDPELSVLRFGFALLVVASLSAWVIRDAPPLWWPPRPDPRRWSVDQVVNPSLRHDHPALKYHSTAEVLRSPAAWVLAAMVTCVSAAALFDLGYLALFGTESGWHPTVAAVGLAVFAAASGGVRPLAVWAAGKIGRVAVLRTASVATAAAQLVLLGAGADGGLGAFLPAAFVAGAGTGCWYALLPGLIKSHFGDLAGMPNLWLVYSAKAIGGALGLGAAGMLVSGQGYAPAFVGTALLCAGSAVLFRWLRRPGMPRTLPVGASRSAGTRVLA